VIAMNCNDVRETLALQPTIEDADVQAHIDACEGCARYRKQHQALDVVLRAEMRWEAPEVLTARLLAIAAAPELAYARPLAASAGPAPLRATRPRPKAWYVTTVYALTLAAVAVSLLIGWQLAGMLLSQVPIGAAITQIMSLPGQGLAYLAQALPESRIAIDILMRIRTQLMWLLLVAVLWAALDKWNPQFTIRGRQISL
jgi:anti-sigma factor RsiW